MINSERILSNVERFPKVRNAIANGYKVTLINDAHWIVLMHGHGEVKYINMSKEQIQWVKELGAARDEITYQTLEQKSFKGGGRQIKQPGITWKRM